MNRGIYDAFALDKSNHFTKEGQIMYSNKTLNSRLYYAQAGQWEDTGFISDYDQELLHLLNAQAGEHILDIGCGDGDIMHEISRSGATVTGIDYSLAVIQYAKAKYPALSFVHANAENYRVEEQYDAIISNDSLHWMKNADEVIDAAYGSLKPGGRFVVEFGGEDNVATVSKRVITVLKEDFGLRDVEKRQPWYFPSIAEYSALLEQQGFHVAYAKHFNRPTLLPDGWNGMRHWIAAYMGDFFIGMTESQQEAAYQLVMARCKNDLFDGSMWCVDYTRLRITAYK